MRLDDAEKLAREWLSEYEIELLEGDRLTYPTLEQCEHLARTLLAVLPVVKAAMAYRDAKYFDRYEGTAVEEAIDTMRRALEKP